MSKKIVCLLLALLMVVTVFTSCAGDDSDDAINDAKEEASETTVTLSMYLVSEKEVSKEQATAIQEAVNKITKSKFKAQLILHFFTEDTYYEALDAAFAKMDENTAFEDAVTDELANKKDEAVTGETEEETVKDEYGNETLKYPEIPDYQVDILYLSGFENLKKYVDEERLAMLDDNIANTSTILKSYIAPDYLSRLDNLFDGRTYALPVNAPIGNFKYLLVNKEIMSKYNHVASDFTSIISDNTETLLEMVKELDTDYVPFRSLTENAIPVPYAKYLGTDENGYLTNTFSVMGGMEVKSWSFLNVGHYVSSGTILANQVFQNALNTVARYKELGYYYGPDEEADKPFAIGYAEGGAELKAQYGDDYEFVVLQNPTFTARDLCANMFAVTEQSSDIARSMQILTHLNTDVEFRNLLLYGIENENYELIESEPDENGKTYQYVKRLNENYMMAPEKTGNMYTIYPLEGQPLNLTDYYKEQNAAAHTDILLNFTYIECSENVLHPDLIKTLNEYSQKVLLELNEIETEAEMKEYLAEQIAFMKTDENVKAAMGTKYENPKDSEITYVTLQNYYTEWIIFNDLMPET